MVPVYLTIEVLLFAFYVLRMGFAPMPGLYLVYLMLGHVVLALTAGHIIWWFFLDIWSSHAFMAFEPSVQQALFLLFCFYFLSGWQLGTQRQSVAVPRLNASSIVPNTPILAALAIALYLRLAIDFSAMDLKVIWHNSTYLAMADVNYLAEDSGLARLAHRSASLAGLLADCLATILLLNRRYRWALIFLPLALWQLLFELAGHSRYAVVYVGVIAILCFVLLKGPARYVASILGVGLAYLFLLTSLNGRDLGSHGFASLPDLFVFSDFWVTVNSTIINAFEGIFVFAEHFRAQFIFDPAYKILSFSPLPSALDGFPAVKASSEIPIHRYVPRGALDEALDFGWGYTAVYLGVQFLAIRYSLANLRRFPGILSMTLNVVLLLMCFVQLAYPVRWVFRPILFILLITAFRSAFQHPPGAAVRPPLPAQPRPQGKLFVRTRITPARPGLAGAAAGEP